MPSVPNDGCSMTDTATEGLRAWLAATPPGASVVLSGEQARALAQAPSPEPISWRERIWTAGAATELSIYEAAEAVGRSVAWIHRRSGAAARRPTSDVTPIPCVRRDGRLVFIVGELRDFLRRTAEE